MLGKGSGVLSMFQRKYCSTPKSALRSSYFRVQARWNWNWTLYLIVFFDPFDEAEVESLCLNRIHSFPLPRGVNNLCLVRRRPRVSLLVVKSSLTDFKYEIEPSSGCARSPSARPLLPKRRLFLQLKGASNLYTLGLLHSSEPYGPAIEQAKVV